MLARATVFLAVLGASLGIVCQQANASSVPIGPITQAYLDVSFTAGIRDTTRDTTVVGGSVMPLTEAEASFSTALAAASTMMSMGSATTLPMAFSLFVQDTGNIPAPVWSDTLPSVPIDNQGAVHVVLGTHKPLNAMLFSNHQFLYLEIAIAGERLSPRIMLVSPGNVLMLNVVGVNVIPTPDKVAPSSDAPLMLVAGRSSMGAVAMNRRRLVSGRAIVLGDDPAAGGGWSAGPLEAQLMYRLKMQEALILELRAQVARLQPQTKKDRK